MINYVLFWLAWLSYGSKNTVGAVKLAKKIYPSLSAYPNEGAARTRRGGPVDNRPSTDKLHHFVRIRKNKKIKL